VYKRQAEATSAQWRTPQDIVDRHRSADILPGNRVVFNIKGNQYRLVVKIHYNTGVVYIRFVGKHAEYNRIDAEAV
jgi:mRNA interferase HigB